MKFLLSLLSLLILNLSALSPVSAVEPTKADIPYKTPEGRKNPLILDLYYPEKKQGSPFPVVVYTHGGGWAAGSPKAAAKGRMNQVVAGLLEEGFAVAAIQYRLYNKDGNISIKDCVTDCKDGIRYLAKNKEELNLDTDRVFTWGDSAGGQLCQMLLLTKPDLFPGDPALASQTYTTVAGVSWYGPCDFEKTELFNHDGRPDFRDRFGLRILKPDSKPEDKLELYREMSPINYLSESSPPLLMIQGDKDTTIPVHHAHYMQEKAKAAQAPVEILIVKNAGHNWRSAGAPIEPDDKTIVNTTVEFLAKHLKD
jgi:acetyl esterase/lipase